MGIINVTKSSLPDLKEYSKYLAHIWETGWLTNNGEYSVELENKLKEYLGVKHLIFLSNGTIALQIALQGLEIQGEVITTPFSYIATTSSLIWEKCIPVFADIDRDNYCLDPKEVEKTITSKTKAILATHVFGNACDVEAFDKISKDYNIPIIYDAAHAFGVKRNQNSILNFGSVSTLSFHATKLFHTIEGGALVTNDDELAHKMEYMRRFGHNGAYKFHGVGINGKNSELHAAMGLCLLPKLPDIITKRKDIYNLYRKNLTSLTFQKISTSIDWNYAYCPVVFDSEDLLLKAEVRLNEENIYPRRYFFPSLNTIDYLYNSQQMPISESIASRVLCLPFYPDLSHEDVTKICNLINEVIC